MSEANLTAEQLLQAVKQLPLNELQEFTQSLYSPSTETATPCLSPQETELFIKISEGIPADIKQRYDCLYEKWHKDMDKLPPAEYEELVRLNGIIEHLNVQRLEALTGLAQLQQKPLRQLMAELGLKTPIL